MTYAPLYSFTPELRESSIDGLIGDVLSHVFNGSVTYDQEAGQEGSQMVLSAMARSPLGVNDFSYVAPFIRIIREDGNEIYEQLGLYVLIPSGWVAYPGYTEYRIEGRDLCWFLASNSTDDVYNVAENDNVVDSIISDLSALGITRHNIPASASVFSKNTSWPADTTWLKIINEKLKMIEYESIAFNRLGIPVSRPKVDPLYSEPAVEYSGGSGSIIVPPIESTPDITAIGNRAVVKSTDPANGQLIAIRINTDPLSPISYANVGNVWITIREESPELQTQAAVNNRAIELLKLGAYFNNKVTLITHPDPYRNPHETYLLSDVQNQNGEVISGKWYATGWTFSLDPDNPQMYHTICQLQEVQVSIP